MNEYFVPRGQTPVYYRNRKNGEVTDAINSLPLSSRSIDEIMDDRAIEVAFQASQNRSIIRRRPRRYEAAFVVGFLDDLSDTVNSIGERTIVMAMYNAHLLSSAENLEPSKLQG